jgi:hypothetical protein
MDAMTVWLALTIMVGQDHPDGFLFNEQEDCKQELARLVESGKFMAASRCVPIEIRGLEIKK